MQLSKRISNVEPSLTLAISAKEKEMKKQGIPVIGFGAGEPDFDTPDNVKKAAIDAINKGYTKYTPASGIVELKEAICKKLKRDNNLEYSNANIVVSCGAKHSIYNIIQVLCEEGDEVLIPAPYWLSYPEIVKLASAEPVIIQAASKNNFKITTKDLEKFITSKTKVLILNSPSNPTGSVYSKEELKALADFLSNKDIYIISDEIYEKIVYDVTHISIASLSKKIFDKTIVVNGMSKVYSMPGWRIGYLAGNKEIADAVANLQSHTTSNPTSISQWASVEGLNGDQSFIDKMAKEFRKRRDYIVDRLNNISGIECLNPEGAFYVFPKITGLNRGGSMEVTEKLLQEAHVAVVPGAVFGADEYIRLSYATSMKNIQEGMDRLEKWIG